VSTNSTTGAIRFEVSKKILRLPGKRIFGAEDRARTGHPDLGKVVLYQMSYFRDFYNVPEYFLASKELRGCKNRYYDFCKKIFS